MTAIDRRPRVALLVNLVAPYRVVLYDEIARAVDLTVLYSGHEDNRVGWEDAHCRLSRARAQRVAGWVLKRTRPAVKGTGPGPGVDVGYLHLSPGYVSALIRVRPDAIVTTELGVRTMLALGYGRLTGIPVWIMIESSLHTERRLGRARSLLRGIIRRLATRWIAIGECSAEYLRSLGIPGTQVMTIQGTVDERPFTFEDRSRDSTRRSVALCVGQLVPRKGLARLLEAVATLARRGFTAEGAEFAEGTSGMTPRTPDTPRLGPTPRGRSRSGCSGRVCVAASGGPRPASRG